MSPKKVIAVAALFVCATINAQAEILTWEPSREDNIAYQHEEPAAYDDQEYAAPQEDMDPQYESEPDEADSGTEGWEQELPQENQDEDDNAPEEEMEEPSQVE